MSTKVLDLGFRRTLGRNGVNVAFDMLTNASALGSLYALDPEPGDEGSQPVYAIPQEDGFVILAQVGPADLAQEIIDAVRDPEDGYSLILYPPAVEEGAEGGISLGMRLGEYVFDDFPGWDAVISDPRLNSSFAELLAAQARALRSYSWTILNRLRSDATTTRQEAFGGLQALLYSPQRISSGEVSADEAIGAFESALNEVPDADSYRSMRMWISGYATLEKGEGLVDGPWSRIDAAATAFGEQRGWNR